MRYVIQRTDTKQYLKPRASYWVRQDLIRTNNGDDSTWTHDLQKARVFSTKSAAITAFTGPHYVVLLGVKLELV